MNEMMIFNRSVLGCIADDVVNSHLTIDDTIRLLEKANFPYEVYLDEICSIIIMNYEDEQLASLDDSWRNSVAVTVGDEILNSVFDKVEGKELSMGEMNFIYFTAVNLLFETGMMYWHREMYNYFEDELALRTVGR